MSSVFNNNRIGYQMASNKGTLPSKRSINPWILLHIFLGCLMGMIFFGIATGPLSYRSLLVPQAMLEMHIVGSALYGVMNIYITRLLYRAVTGSPDLDEVFTPKPDTMEEPVSDSVSSSSSSPYKKQRDIAARVTYFAPIALGSNILFWFSLYSVLENFFFVYNYTGYFRYGDEFDIGTATIQGGLFWIAFQSAQKVWLVGYLLYFPLFMFIMMQEIQIKT